MISPTEFANVIPKILDLSTIIDSGGSECPERHRHLKSEKILNFPVETENDTQEFTFQGIDPVGGGRMPEVGGNFKFCDEYS